MESGTNEVKHEWNELAKCPCERFSVPFKINDNEFAIAVVTNVTSFTYNGVMKYNLAENKWIEWIRYPYTFKTNYHTAYMDRHKNILYIYNSEQILTKIDLLTHKTEHTYVEKYDGAFSSSLFVNNEFHLFGGWDHSKHLVWNDADESFDEIYEFGDFEQGFIDHEAVYIKSQNRMYLFGGKDSCSMGNTGRDIINCYCLSDKIWSELTVKMPIAMEQFAALVTSNDQYIILIKSGIYILDLNTMMFTQSKIKMPADDVYRAFIYEDNKGKHSLIDGYIRDMGYIANDLVNVIMSFYCNEYVHVISYSRNRNHWKINVDVILNAV